LKKIALDDLAVFGGNPLFQQPLHVGQLKTPPVEKLEEAFRGIFERRYFSNNGPLVRELDKRFAEHLGVRNAVCVTNGTMGLIIALESLGLTGEIIVPTFTFPATVQAPVWAGLKPVFCDVDPETHTITPETVAPVITDRTAAIMGVHLWGRACDVEGLQSLADQHGLKLIFDAAHAIDCTYQGQKIGGFGQAEAFSFHATKILNGTEGGCITTNDDDLADAMRTIRTVHESETFADVTLRLNGRMSEAQAALALLSLEDLTENIAENKKVYQAYSSHIKNIPGIELIQYDSDEQNNYQYVIIDVIEEEAGLSRDIIVEILKRENIMARKYFYPGAHRMQPFAGWYPKISGSLPVTESLCSRLFQLPNSDPMRLPDVEKLCELLRFIVSNASTLSERLPNHRA
jgi:dTDP-4-amino-4,6-dideoxygalactose transaminase